MIVVIDTSALLRLFIPDGPIPAGLTRALREAERGEGALLAPELIQPEAAQALRKKHREGILSREEMEELLECILSLPIKLFGHRALIRRASALAREDKLTVYDSLFLALAEAKNARLLTADRALAKAAEKLELF
jgi:predicted nucleic acid-binding protein